LSYIVAETTNGQITTLGLFGSYTVLTFMTFFLYFMAVILYGVLANDQKDGYSKTVQKLLMKVQEQQFAKAHEDRYSNEFLTALRSPTYQWGKSAGISQAMYAMLFPPLKADEMLEAKLLLKALYDYLIESWRVNVLGITLNTGIISVLFAGLATASGTLIPIFFKIFYGTSN